MPTPTENYRKLLTEKCPPTSEREHVYASIVIALSDTVDTLSAQVITLSKTMKIISDAVAAALSDDDDGAEAKAAPTAGEGNSAAAGVDKTPFPAGVPTQGPLATGFKTQVVASQAVPGEIPAPDVQGQPAVNAAPIPKRVAQPAGNGAPPKGVA
jgi:hypothetical protein